MTSTRTPTDRLRLAWLSARYDFWLDLHSVPRKTRRELRHELLANVTDAAATIGVPAAIANIGGVRHFARQTVRDGDLRSPWSAAIVASLSTVAGLVVAFLFLSLYYVEGALDAGSDETVSSRLFPFFWSQVDVEPATAGGFGFTVSPGPLPFVVGLIVLIAVAKPWRSVRRQTIKGAVKAL